MIEYKDIEDFPGYKIGNNGSVLSSKHRKGYIKTFPNPEGYMFVYLYKDNKKHVVSVHRLVAKYFVPNPNNYDCVNHKDENKANNNASNLEWCSHSYNRKYGTCEDRRSLTLSRIFAIDQYDLQGNFIRRWHNAREAARGLGLKKNASTSIINCTNHISETSYGYIWKKVI